MSYGTSKASSPNTSNVGIDQHQIEANIQAYDNRLDKCLQAYNESENVTEFRASYSTSKDITHVSLPT